MIHLLRVCPPLNLLRLVHLLAVPIASAARSERTYTALDVLVLYRCGLLLHCSTLLLRLHWIQHLLLAERLLNVLAHAHSA